jgi:hypothetical protein
MSGELAKEKLNELLNDALTMAQKLIEEHGSHIPFAMAVNGQGNRVNIAVDDIDRPGADVHISTLLSVLRERCGSRELAAVAFVRNVEYQSAVDGTLVDAIEVNLDHVEAEAVTCYLPYSLAEKRRFVAGELFATAPREIFFKPVTL